VQLETVLSNIDQGAIALPQFQRGYVWNRGQVRGLMDSLYRGHPVGTLLTWLTATDSAVARGDGSLQPGSVQLLLDGQQRVTTLYGLIKGSPPPFFEGNSAAFDGLKFHLDDQLFEFWQPVKMKDDPLWVDVREIFKLGAGQFIGRLYAEHNGDPRIQDWVDRINRIDGIRSRTFHVEQVAGDDKTVDVVVEIFNRVNSGGTKLSKGDLALAKICAEWPDARDRMNGLLAKWADQGFGGFTLDWLLRVVNAVLTGRAPFSALVDVTPAEFQDGLKRGEKAVDVVLNALAGRLGINAGSVLPATFPLVILARFVDRNGGALGDHEQRDRLLYWYIHASMWGRYAGSTETVLAQDLQHLSGQHGDPTEGLLSHIRRTRGDLTVRPGDFWAWSRGARFFPILYMLTRVLEARDWASGVQLSKNSLGGAANLDVHHIFPKSLLYEAGHSRPEVNAIANFTFLTQETNIKVSNRRPQDYIPEYDAMHPGVVAGHWIPMDPGVWAIERYTEFLERRRSLLANAANDFLGELYAGHMTGDDITPVSVSIDDADAHDNATEEAVIAELRAWMIEEGLDPGHVDYALPDGTGGQSAILDVAWPDGVQVGLTDRVALLLNEPPEVAEVAGNFSFVPYTDASKFRAYCQTLLDGAVAID